MPPLSAAQRAQGQWKDPGRWTCLEPGCMPPWWRDGGPAAWRYHQARYHRPHQRARCTEPTVIGVIETGRQDDTVRHATDLYLDQLLDHMTRRDTT